MAPRRTVWTLTTSNSAVAASTKVATDLGAALSTSLGGGSKNGYTATRMIINITYKPTLVGSGHVQALVGIIRVQDAAFAAGVASLPNPSASTGQWMFLDDVWLPNNGNEQAVGVFTTFSVIRSFDIRSNRKLQESDTLVLVKEAGPAALTVGTAVRTLWLVP